MQPVTPGLIVGRFLGLSLLGVVMLSLSGVIAGLLLPFLIGYGVYVTYRYFARGEAPKVKEQIVEPAKKVAGVAYQGSKQVTGGLFGLLRGITRGFFWLLTTIIGGGWTLASEVLAGCILGAALGVVIGWPTETDRYLVFAGAGGGALLGLFNAIGSIRSKQRMAQLRKLELAVAKA
jgi:hypothetical protein